MGKIVRLGSRPASQHQESIEPPPRTKALLDAVPDMLFRIDRAGRYLEFKPAPGVEPYVPPAEFLGRRISEVLPPKLAASVMRVIKSVIASGEPGTIVYQLPVDDEMHDYEARVVSLGDGEVLAVVRDMTVTGLPSAATAGVSRSYGLSKRELAVLRLVAVGLTDKEIGQRLNISSMTVSKHVASVRKKMGAHSRTDASVRAVKEGLLG